MTITKMTLSLCPARVAVFYTDDNGEDKYIYAIGFGVCYTCADYLIKRSSGAKMRGESHE